MTLRPDHVLATVALTAVRGRPSRPRRVHLSDVVHGVPLAHPVSDAPDRAPPGNELFGIWMAFDLVRLRCVRHTAVYLRLGFDDPGVTILRLEGAADQIGFAYEGDELRAHTDLAAQALAAARRSRPGWPLRASGAAVVASDTLHTAAAGLLFEPAGPDPLPDHYAAHALVAAPTGSPNLTGGLRVDLSARRAATAGILHAAAPEPVPFTLGLPASAAPSARVPTADAAPPREERSAAVTASRSEDRFGGDAARAGVRLCMAADIERFSRFRTPEAERAQQRFVELLQAARRQAGAVVAAEDVQKSGDGQFTVLPDGIDEAVAIPLLVDGLRKALSAGNADLNGHARLRLRVALHRGHVVRGVNGWVGHSTIAVHRLLDSPPLRTALTDHPHSDFALMVSDVLYRDVISHGFAGLDPESFTHTMVEIPAKSFIEPAWIYLPD